jgi:hypothetical protein
LVRLETDRRKGSPGSLTAALVGKAKDAAMV